MREVIIREWRDDLGIVHRDEVGELVRLEKGLKMLWEASDETCKNIEVAGEKILEISDGWYIDKVACPDKKWGKDMNSLIIEIRRDSKRA